MPSNLILTQKSKEIGHIVQIEEIFFNKNSSSGTEATTLKIVDQALNLLNRKEEDMDYSGERYYEYTLRNKS